MLEKLFCLSQLLLLIILAVLPSARTEALDLAASVTTEKPGYHYRELVRIFGNATFEGRLVEEGLVAVQIRDPSNKTLALRTVPANATPSENWAVEIESFITTDSTGNPENVFELGRPVYFKTTVRNNDVSSSRTILLSISLFDSDSTPFMFHWLRTTVDPQETIEEIVGLYTYDLVSAGNAMAYASVYNDWPCFGGYAYSPEASLVFNVVSSGETSSFMSCFAAATSGDTYSSYETEFRLSPQAQLGRYTIAISVLYHDSVASVVASFTRDYEVLGDIVFDGRINIFDLVKTAYAYGTRTGDSKWSPEADFNADGFVDVFDIVAVSVKYGMSYLYD